MVFFCKKQLQLTMRGVTNNERDASVDLIRTVTLPLLKHFGIEDGLELKISKRGAPPLGGGEVVLKCLPVRTLKAVQLTDEGKIKRIRGISYCTRMSPQTANRCVESARGILNSFIPDVYIYSDPYKGKDSGLSPGFALALVAESTTNALISADVVGEAQQLPEDVGAAAAKLLCEEISKGGCVDSANQSIALLLMALGPEDVSKLRVGTLSQYTIQSLRLIKKFLGVTFRIQADPTTKTVLMTCRGVGYTNLTKKIN